MTPIELALAKAMSAIIGEAGDMAIDKGKDGLMNMINPKSNRQKREEKLYEGFLHHCEDKKIKENNYKKEDEYHRNKIKTTTNRIAMSDISERFENMVNGMNKLSSSRKSMRMVANRVKKRRRKKGKR